MAFDQTTRTRLARFVGDARSLLAEEFTRQLQNDYGLDPATGDVTDLATLKQLDDARRETARLLREMLKHYVASACTDTAAKSKKACQEALDRIVREQAFTVLNRLCALRMAEARGLLIESVANGYLSKGFQLYQRVAGTALGETGDAYRVYLFSVFDEFAVDLPVLFDRFSGYGRLFPREVVLTKVLNQINHADIDPLWSEDETIGWIYQYFNTDEDRRLARYTPQGKAKAPQNSRELAVRNQFFTPRYVVEFLTDNSLGRIWYEMTLGQTALTNSCRYLVRRPNEVFLAVGERAPTLEEPTKPLSQDEFLKKPFHILRRQLKDPRDIKMLDPACGSMHFGLYAFDLFERIYDEAWSLESERGAEDFVRSDGLGSLHETYTTKDAFLRDVPRLIIERNIHGIDIDPRAVQIAGLSLWLRAQRTWHTKGVKVYDRPQIRRSNIVCAETIPGEASLLQDFIDKHLSDTPESRLLGQLLRRIVDAMTLAGEAGSLLKIEEEVAAAVADAKKAWLAGPTHEQQRLFGGGSTTTSQLKLRFDVAGITNAVFWEKAEERIYSSLKAYSEQVESGGGFQRRLFAEDAAMGFAFIDICRKRYDVALMNPPFGDFVPGTNRYVGTFYPQTSIDFFASFVERGCLLIDSGLVGAITPRAFLFTKTLEAWRRSRVLDSLTLLLDMGFGVLDGSIVETCAYVLARPLIESEATIIDIRASAPMYYEALERVRESGWVFQCSRLQTRRFKSAPRARFLYYLSNRFFALLQSDRRFDPIGGTAKNGLQTYGDERFLRLIWEVPDLERGRGHTWLPIAKGGDYETFYFPVHLVINYAQDGLECGEVNRRDNGQTSQTKRNSEYYYRPAATYPAKSTRGFSVRQLPAGSLFALKGPAILPADGETPAYLIGWVNSNLIRGLVMSQASTGEYLAGIVQNLPWVSPTIDVRSTVEAHSLAVIQSKQRIYAIAETDSCFCLPWLGRPRESLAATTADIASQVEETNRSNLTRVETLSEMVRSLYGVEHFDPAEWGIEDDDHSVQLSKDEWKVSAFASKVLSFAVGCALGRWDIRYATCENTAPKMHDPFGLVPICPPGQLQNGQGFPARLEDVPARYPLAIIWDGILVDDPNHPADIHRCILHAIEAIWLDRAEAIEHEVCEILAVESLREYFRRTTGFFADHLDRYTMSRRSAPIYWPLSTPSGAYTLWVYYHRLTDQTLYTCVNDFVEPKIKQVTDEVVGLRAKPHRSSAEEKELERLNNLGLELKDFRDELLRIAKFLKPDLNDGVEITAAPLWKLFQHRQWQTRLKQTWEQLEAGEYDWAHLALSIWPDRVVKASHKDRSYAIAHDLEDKLWEEVPTGKDRQGNPKYEWRPRKLTEKELNQIIAEIKARK